MKLFAGSVQQKIFMQIKLRFVAAPPAIFYCIFKYNCASRWAWIWTWTWAHISTWSSFAPAI